MGMNKLKKPKIETVWKVIVIISSILLIISSLAPLLLTQ